MGLLFITAAAGNWSYQGRTVVEARHGKRCPMSGYEAYGQLMSAWQSTMRVDTLLLGARLRGW
jgi:hypothetical protein